MGITDLLFPKECLSCKKPGRYVCLDCLNKLPTLRQICVKCGRPAVDGMTHTRCRRPWGLDGLVFIWPYGGVIRKAILGLKYKYAKEIAKELAEYTVMYLRKRKAVLPKTSTFIPIPLYFLRQNWRGFNQVEEIGKLIAPKMKWEYREDILIRKRFKKPQAGLKKDERSKNIRGVFALNPNLSPATRYQLLTPKRKASLNSKSQASLILFDDILTTGSTMKEAARVLKRNGAEKVWGLTIAR